MLAGTTTSISLAYHADVIRDSVIGSLMQLALLNIEGIVLHLHLHLRRKLPLDFYVDLLEELFPFIFLFFNWLVREPCDDLGVLVGQ